MEPLNLNHEVFCEPPIQPKVKEYSTMFQYVKDLVEQQNILIDMANGVEFRLYGACEFPINHTDINDGYGLLEQLSTLVSTNSYILEKLQKCFGAIC